jgi:hypothetical protein
MVYLLIAISLLIMLGLGLAAIFLGGSKHGDASVEDPEKDEE